MGSPAAGYGVTGSIDSTASTTVLKDQLDDNAPTTGFTVDGAGTESEPWRIIYPEGSGNFAPPTVTLSTPAAATTVLEDITYKVQVSGSGVSGDEWVITFPGYQDYQPISIPYMTTGVELAASDLEDVHGNPHSVPLISQQLIDFNPDVTHTLSLIHI